MRAKYCIPSSILLVRERQANQKCLDCISKSAVKSPSNVTLSTIPPPPGCLQLKNSSSKRDIGVPDLRQLSPPFPLSG